jgi:hypothetical protein
MNLKEYFEKTQGIGVLATADRSGRVDAAVYSRPHIMADEALAFIMRDRLRIAKFYQSPCGLSVCCRGSRI